MRRAASLRLVAGREVIERLRSRTTWLLTALTAALVAGLILVPALLQRPPKALVVGLVGTAPQALAQPLTAAAEAVGVPLRTSSLVDMEAARSALGDHEVDAVVSGTGDAATLTVLKSVPAGIEALVRGVVTAVRQRSELAAAGVAPAVTDRALAPATVQVTVLQPEPEGFVARFIAGLAAGYLLTYVILGYAASVAMGVAQEKTSRTAEVLLSAVPPGVLLAGKVLGIGLVGFGQMLVAVVVGLVSNLLVKRIDIPATVWTMVPTLLLWFLLGYTLYAFASAAAGALVARPEEVQSVNAPFVVVLIAALLLTYAVVYAPDRWWVVLLSLVPPLTPVLMPARMAMTAVPWWQLGLAVALMLASIAGIVRLGAGIYAASLVRSGARIGWGDALRRRP